MSENRVNRQRITKARFSCSSSTKYFSTVTRQPSGYLPCASRASYDINKRSCSWALMRCVQLATRIGRELTCCRWSLV